MIAFGPLAAAPLAAASADPAAQALIGLGALDSRVAEVGHRLAVANRDLCGEQAPLAGIVLHHLSQYGVDYRPAAVRAFGLAKAPAVLAVVPGGPAAKAGIRPNDTLLAVNGTAFSQAKAPAASSFAAVEQALDQLDAAMAAGPVSVTLSREGRQLSATLQPEWGCASRFQAVPSRQHRARADGRYVQISSTLVSYARDDGELAAVLAHELAHNVLRHRVRLTASGRKNDPRLVRATEVEADRLSVYLIDRAGYPLDAPPRFWERFRKGGAIFQAATHPGWRERARIMRDEAAELERLKQHDPRPVPPLMRTAAP